MPLKSPAEQFTDYFVYNVICVFGRKLIPGLEFTAITLNCVHRTRLVMYQYSQHLLRIIVQCFPM